METIHDRLVQLLKELKLGQGAFEKRVGLANGFVSKVKNDIRFSSVVRMKAAFPEIDTLWLLTGQRPDAADEVSEVCEPEPQYLTSNRHGARFYELHGGGYRMEVPVVPYYALGSFTDEGDGQLQPDMDGVEWESFDVDRVARGNYLSFEVHGDSMDDGTRQSFEDGDRVLARELEREYWADPIRFKRHPFWVVAFGTSVRIKQIVAQDLERGTLTFHSLNPSPEYTDFTLSENDITRLFYIIRKKPKTVEL